MAKRASIRKKVLRTGALLLGVYLGVCWMLSGIYLSPSRTRPLRPAEFSETTIAGTPAWVTPALTTHKQPPTVVIFAHGYGGDRGHWTELMQRLDQEGIWSVALAMPGQDASPIANVGFGPAEAEVIAKAVEWAHEKSAQKIIVAGVSMGGAATWLATAKTPHIDGVVTEGAYARFDEAMDDWLNAASPGGTIVLRPVVWMATRRSGLDPGMIVPLDAAKRWKKPSLIIQADDDRLIRRSHADRLSAASGGELWCVPNAAHANCYTADPSGYEDRFVRFVKAIAETP